MAVDDGHLLEMVVLVAEEDVVFDLEHVLRKRIHLLLLVEGVLVGELLGVVLDLLGVELVNFKSLFI